MILTKTAAFRSIYDDAGAYEHTLLPHYFDGRTDVEIIAALMREHYGTPGHRPGLDVIDLGCGTGRITQALAPHARTLLGIDGSPAMIGVFGRRFPHATGICRDIRTAVEQLAAARPGWADIVGAFWSLSYPLGDLYETLTVDGITPTTDLPAARAQARAFLRQILDLLAPTGHLLIIHFDADSPEQQLVTRLWEAVAPFPENGRGYLLELILTILRQAEAAGQGRLRHTRHAGAAVADDLDAARRWFHHQHLKSLPSLMTDHVTGDVEQFLRRHPAVGGQVLIPVGMHVVDFWKATPDRHLPATRRHGRM